MPALTTVRVDLTSQLLTTAFLVVLFWILYANFRRLRFFQHWTRGWIAFACFVASALLYPAGSASALAPVMSVAGQLFGLFQLTFLYFGVEVLRQPERDDQARVRWGILLTVLVWATAAAVDLFRSGPGSSEAGLALSLVRQFGSVVIYGYAAAVFSQKILRKRNSAGEFVAAVGCAILGAHQLFYALHELGLFAGIPKGAIWEFMTLIDIAGELIIASGMVLVLIEEYRSAEHGEWTARRGQQEAEDRYRTLVEQLAAITYVAEQVPQRRLLFISPQVRQIFGDTAEQWLSDPGIWRRRIYPDDLPVVRGAIQEMLRAGLFQAQYRIYRRDGRIVWVNQTGVRVQEDATGRVLLHGLAIDVTAQKEMEARALASQRMEAVGSLAASVAHDFNNALTVIKGFTSILLDPESKPERVRRGALAIHEAAEKAEQLTRQLLAFGRKQLLQPKIISVNQVVREAEGTLRVLLGSGIEPQLNLSEDAGHIYADPAQLEQVLMNLAINGRDAMPHGGRLTVETRAVELDAHAFDDALAGKPGPYVMLAVRDTGMGMTKDVQAKIFEPFFTTKETGKGTGLGLASVYGIVKQSGGHIRVRSEPGAGASFEIYFPRCDAPLQATAFKNEESAGSREDARRDAERSAFCEAEEGSSNGFPPKVR